MVISIPSKADRFLKIVPPSQSLGERGADFQLGVYLPSGR